MGRRSAAFFGCAAALAVIACAAEAFAQGVAHAPPDKAAADRGLEVSIKIPTAQAAGYSYISVFYKRRGGVIYKSVFMQPAGAAYVATVPGDFVTFPGIEYYISARTRDGAVQNLFASPAAPQFVPVAEEARDEEEEDEVSRAGTDLFADELAVFAAEAVTVVSAARVEQVIYESPSAISVVSARDIQNYASESLPEVLRTLPGVEVMRTYTMNPEVTARGFTREGQNKVLTLVDGRSIYIDLFGTTFWEFMPVSVWEVKQVEVIRGPGSALYGANAFSGVVSIFTKRPEDIKGFQLNQTAGETGIYTSLLAGDVKDKVGYRAATSFSSPYKYDERFDSAGQVVRGDGLVEYKIGANQTASFSGGFNRGKATPIFTLIGPIEVEATQGFAKGDLVWHDFKLQTFYSILSADLQARFPFPEQMQLPEDVKIGNVTLSQGTPLAPQGFGLEMPPVFGYGHTFDVEAMNTFPIAEVDRLTIGGNVRYVTFSYRTGAEAEDADWNGANQVLFGSFVQNEYRPIPEIITTLGFRFDLQSVQSELPDGTKQRMQPNYSPRASVVFLPHPDHSIRLGGGLAFRNPAFMESDLRMNVVPAGPKTLVIEEPTLPASLREVKLKDVAIDYYGNPGLEPEKILSLEAGYGVRLWNRVRINLDFFYQQVYGLILFQGDINKFFAALDTQQDVSNEDVFTFQNLADARNIGVEAAADVAITEWLRVFANYSWQKITLLNKEKYRPEGCTDPECLEKFPMPTLEEESPENKINAGINVSRWHADLNVYGHFVSRTHRENFITNLPAQEIKMNFAGKEFKWVLRDMSATPSKITGDVPAYFLLNANAAYSFLDDIFRVGFGCEDILGSSDSLVGDGIVTDAAGNPVKVQSGRALQYPRSNLFGGILGGELIGRRFYGFLSAKF
ncbi:MAG: TonB-dependent receptor [Deltaproteobacteria bacterium]|nr:TonB-dependent receptor [Deltaproteobacteria bacterium]